MSDFQFNNTCLKPLEILLVEDSPSDAYLTVEALNSGKLLNNLHHVEDGIEALAFLYRQGKYNGVPRPDLILLDLNLPKKNGHEVLEQIKTDPSLKIIPVIILTTSSAKRDILKTYELNCNCYITKPMDLDQFICVVKLIELFWLTVVKLPSE